MSQEWTTEQITTVIKRDLLLDKLDLASGGLKLEDIHDDTQLLHEGLALDSVDALDLLVAVEKTFALKLPDPDRAFIERTCQNVGTLTQFVSEELARKNATANA
jgi:acyl carrier protein